MIEGRAEDVQGVRLGSGSPARLDVGHDFLQNCSLAVHVYVMIPCRRRLRVPAAGAPRVRANSLQK